MKMRIVIYAVLLAAVCVNPVFAQPVKRHGQLWIDSTKLKDHHGNVVVLRGMSFGWHNWWPRFYNAEAVRWLHRDWGCSVVRAAMGVDPEKGYLEKPEWSNMKVKSVVDAAIDEGIYVVIDWHTHDIHLDKAKEFFTEMAREYHGYPHVIYEIFNEPDQETWEDVKTYSIELIKTIRAIDPDNLILIGTPHWDQDIHIAADDPILGFQNIMYTVHFYAATHKKWLRDRCEYAMNKGLSLFVSESAGMEATGDGAIDDEEWYTWIDWMEEKQISWILWSVSDKNETCSVLLPSADSEGGWKEKDLKESGIKNRSLIRRFSWDKR
jgi:endoglucanase